MKRFEYTLKRLTAHDSDKAALAEFNLLGSEGWQVFFISPIIGPDNTVMLWMMRELDE